MEQTLKETPKEETKKKSSKKWIILIIVLVIIILLLLGVVGYFVYITYFQVKKEEQKILSKENQEVVNVENKGNESSNKENTSSNKENSSESTKADSYEGWLTYTNNDIGYTLKYPKEWSVKETNGKSEVLNDKTIKHITITSASENNLHFGLKKKDDESFIISDRTGVGAGDDKPLTSKKVTLLGTETMPEAHVFEGKTKEYFYKMDENDYNACQCETLIWFSPKDEIDYENINMSTEEIDTVNLILASVKWLEKENTTTKNQDTEKLNSAKEVTRKFLDARKKRSLAEARPYVTDDYYNSTNQADFAGTSSPSFGKYEILSASFVEAADLYEVKAKIHWNLQGEESGTSTWKCYLVYENGKMLVNEVKEE